ncbi:iron-containing alcohol dehydrogenase [Vibrio sp. M60_M31a]
MLGIPKATTAATGIDALTHALESYVSRWCT